MLPLVQTFRFFFGKSDKPLDRLKKNNYNRRTVIIASITKSERQDIMTKDMFGNLRYKLNLHTHTTLSDGRLSPAETAASYKAMGYDAIAITDHWKYHGEKSLAGLHIISGCEYNVGTADTIAGVSHIVGLGMKSEPVFQSDRSTPQGIIHAIHACGGIAVLAHPAWSLNLPDRSLKNLNYDATEIYNAVSNVAQSCRPYSGNFVDLMANLGVYYPLIAADDAHYHHGIDDGKAYIMVKADELSTEAIIDAIKRRDFYATQGPELHLRREGRKFIVDCSPSDIISFMSNSAWSNNRIFRGSALTHAEYIPADFEKWVRVEVTDAQGKQAWSNIEIV